MIPQLDASFWEALDRLVDENRLVIDRPAGSRHPHMEDVVFPLDYGFLEGTTSPDGEGIDVWVGHAARCTVTDVACTFDLAKKDLELKVLLACTAVDSRRILEFHSTKWQKGWLITRPDASALADREPE